MLDESWRLSRTGMLMGVASLISQRGTCPRLRVGAVIALNGRILMTGYNGAPSGMTHCYHDETIPPEDPTYQTCSLSVHAEQNAIAFAAREGIRVRGAALFCTHSPCIPCAKLIINSGIVAVVYHTPFRDDGGIRFLEAGGVVVEAA